MTNLYAYINVTSEIDTGQTDCTCFNIHCTSLVGRTKISKKNGIEMLGDFRPLKKKE